MRTVEIVRGVFDGKYEKGDQVSVADCTAELLISEGFAKPVDDKGVPDNLDGAQAEELLSEDDIRAMDKKKDLESYAAAIGMAELDSRLKIVEMQDAILNYQQELESKAGEV